MSKIKKIADDIYHFVCPGCNEEHSFNTATWHFNQDFENPTLSPSYLLYGHRFVSSTDHRQIPFRCHSFIRDGNIQFLNDCTHHLKGQTVELPDYY